MKVRLRGHRARSVGDKGDTAQRRRDLRSSREWYPLLVQRSDLERRVAEHFRGVITGDVKRL